MTPTIDAQLGDPQHERDRGVGQPEDAASPATISTIRPSRAGIGAERAPAERPRPPNATSAGRDRAADGRLDARPGRAPRESELRDAPARGRRAGRWPRSRPPMAIARAMPAEPERTDEHDRQGRVDGHRGDRREDRRERVLAGVERPGQDGDQRRARRGRSGTRAAWPRSARGRPSPSRPPPNRSVDDLAARARPPAPAIGSITNRSSRSARVSRPANSASRPTRRVARQGRQDARSRAARR